MAATATANSQPETKPIRWVTLEEAAKLEKFLHKQFVPKGDEKFAKKFFYRVESIIPYTPAGMGGPEDHLYKFMLQKYHRNKTERVNVASDNGSTQELERNAIVDGHQMLNGKWICVDDQANITVDSADLKTKFEPDNVAD
jgi:hypothetical protein